MDKVWTGCGTCSHRRRIVDPDTGEVAEHGWCDCLRAWRFYGWQTPNPWPYVTDAMHYPEWTARPLAHLMPPDTAP
jgi:hypothetical protein